MRSLAQRVVREKWVHQQFKSCTNSLKLVSCVIFIESFVSFHFEFDQKRLKINSKENQRKNGENYSE